MLGKIIFYILPRSIQGWSAKLNYSYLTTLHPKSNCQISWQKEYISSLFFLRRSAKFNFLYLVCNIFWMSTFKILNQRWCDETPQPRLQWQNRRLGVLIQTVRSAFLQGVSFAKWCPKQRLSTQLLLISRQFFWGFFYRSNKRSFLFVVVIYKV